MYLVEGHNICMGNVPGARGGAELFMLSFDTLSLLRGRDQHDSIIPGV